MKTILAYGDSLTWGTNAAPGGPPRHAMADRWPGALAAGLGPGFEVIAEGLGGRTTAYDDHVADCDRNGARILPTILHSHRPVHLAILLLGTNDLKPAVAGSASAAFLGMKRCVEIVQKHSPRLPGFAGTKVLIVAPPAGGEAPAQGAQADSAPDTDALLRAALAHAGPGKAAGKVARATGLDRAALYARALELKGE